MTWAYINQLIDDAHFATNIVRKKGFGAPVRPQDVLVVTSLASDSAPHRFFASPSAEAGLLKEEPLQVQEMCPSFELPGVQARASDFAFLRHSREFLASLVFPGMLTRSVGTLRFFICTVATYRLLVQTVFKTRRLTFTRVALFNRLRRRSYVWRPQDFNARLLLVPMPLRSLSNQPVWHLLGVLRGALQLVNCMFFFIFWRLLAL